VTAVTRRHPYDELVARELADWPGVRHEHLPHGAKSRRLLVTYNGASRKIYSPLTPSDRAHGALNHLNDIRRVLRELGAQRKQDA
jgi:hypothetical protein